MEMSPDAERILREARRRRVHSVVVALIVFLPCTFLVYRYQLYATWFGSFLLWPAATLILVWASAFQKGDKLVLWLRRFHIRRPGGIRFDRILQVACRGFGFAMTVQDSTYRRSLGMSAVKVQILANPLMLASAVIMILTFKAVTRVFGLPDALSAPVPPRLVWLIFGAWFIACVMLSIAAYRRLGYVLLKPVTARKKTLRVLRQIATRKGWHLELGIFVIQCDDSFWREIVELCLSRASAAVIDVTEPSQNVIWELERAFSLMTPESIVLACGVDEGAPKELPVSVREILAGHLPGAAFARAQTFCYPLQRIDMEQHPWSGRKALITELGKRLASAIAVNMH